MKKPERSTLDLKEGQKVNLVAAKPARFVVDFGEYGSIDITAPIHTDICLTMGSKPCTINIHEADSDGIIKLVDD